MQTAFLTKEEGRIHSDTCALESWRSPVGYNHVPAAGRCAHVHTAKNQETVDTYMLSRYYSMR